MVSIISPAFILTPPPLISLKGVVSKPAMPNMPPTTIPAINIYKPSLNNTQFVKENMQHDISFDENLEEDKRMEIERNIGDSGNKSLDLMKRLSDYLGK